MGDLFAAADTAAHAAVAYRSHGSRGSAMTATGRAHGWSNRRIAEEISMSIRTVEGHLYRASQRSGANGRDQLAALLGEFEGRG